MTDQRKQHYSGDQEIIERNIERSREVIEARKHAHDNDDTPLPLDTDMPEPANPRQDLRDVPVGGQTNANVGGGTAKRHKAG